MTNKEQTQTKEISPILVLPVIIYAAIDTYLFLHHNINIMRITTPVILGLVIAIILYGLLHKFFYKWLTRNPINLSFGEPSTPTVKSENAIKSMDATEILPIERLMGLAEQGCPPSQQSNQDTVNSDCPQDSHLDKYDSILVELKKKEIEKQVEIMDAIREYITIKTAPYLSEEDITTLIFNIECMTYDQPESYKPIRSDIDNSLGPSGLRHLAWNIGERLGASLAKRVVFIKKLLPCGLANAILEYLKPNLRDNISSQIPIDVPDKGGYRFHLDADNDDSQQKKYAGEVINPICIILQGFTELVRSILND